MKKKKKPLNVVLGALIAVVAISTLYGQFLLSTSEHKRASTVTKPIEVISLNKKKDRSKVRYAPLTLTSDASQIKTSNKTSD